MTRRPSLSHAPAHAPTPRRHPLNQTFEWRERPATQLRRLSEAERRQYDDLGFVKLEGLFSAGAIAAVTAAIDPFEAEAEAWLRAKGGRVGIATADVITVTIHIASRSQAARDFASQPAIKDVCHDLLGDDVRLYWDQSVYKKTAKAQEVLWHQDTGYAFTEPQAYLTLWVPLVDVDEENGCPWIAPGLHRLGTLEHWRTDIGYACLEDFAGALPVPAKAGDAVVFSSLTPHRTGPNLKLGTVRKAYVLQYCLDGTVTVAPDGARTPQNDPVKQFRVLENGR
ncbi:MAG TPA: phytanoyl-CoA dioxygenase family protein [Caulobacteraceae bacterium]|nr:phytanoyl-CoA dioxygenase family protein [Caulobacteraceae bacterium]